MRKRVVLLACCTGFAMVVATGVSQAQIDGINLTEFRNWLSAAARYQALGELCTGRSHDQVQSEMNGHIGRSFSGPGRFTEAAVCAALCTLPANTEMPGTRLQFIAGAL